MPFPKPSAFLRNLGFTTLTNASVVMATIVAVAYLAHGLDEERFGAYTLARRMVSTFAPIVLVAMDVAVSRSAAMAASGAARLRYLFGAVALSLLPGSVLVGLGLVFARPLTDVIFHSQVYFSVCLASLFMLWGASFYTVLYGYYLGTGNVIRANVWQLATAAVGPLLIAAFLASSGRVALIVFLMGVLPLAAIVPLLLNLYKALVQQKVVLRLKSTMAELWRYGAPRMPGGWAAEGLFTVAPFLAPYFGTLSQGGHLVIGQYPLKVVTGGMAAFGLVVLPKVAQAFVGKQKPYVESLVTDIISSVWHLGAYATLHLLLWADHIVLLWFGPQYSEAGIAIKIFSFGLIPYLAYVMLRSVVDAVEVKAVNTLNLYLALSVSVVGCLLSGWLGFGPAGLAVGSVVGYLVLGFLTVRYFWTGYQLTLGRLLIWHSVLLNLILFAGAVAGKHLLVGLLDGAALGIAILLLEGFLFALYCFALWRLKAGWLIQIERRLGWPTTDNQV